MAGGYLKYRPYAACLPPTFPRSRTPDFPVPDPPRPGQNDVMAIQLNHTIVAAADAETSARWFAELFGLPAPDRLGHFWQVTTANGVGLDFATARTSDIVPQHYAFLVADDEFDAIYGRVTERAMEHWADPSQRHPGEVNHHDGGNGVYFLSNDGHYLEMITRPYGSSA
jgi:hypothetical protein